MLSLIVMLALGLLLGVFAIQNNNPVTVYYGGYTLSNLPLYVVMIGSMLIGVALSWILSLFGWASTTMQLSGKDRAIKQYSNDASQLAHRVEELEKENADLRTEKKEIVEEHREEHTPAENIAERIRHTFS